jgi:hypothetical protein
MSAVSFSREELARLPLDVILSHVVPLPAQQQPARPSVDEWAVQLFNWVEPRRDAVVSTLPEYCAVLGYGSDYKVHESPLSAFVTYGAEQDMPFSVYERLDVKNEEQVTPLHSWLSDLHHRRLVQAVRQTMVSTL